MSPKDSCWRPLPFYDHKSLITNGLPSCDWLWLLNLLKVTFHSSIQFQASTGLLDVKGLMILFGGIQLVASLSCIFLLKRTKTTVSEYTSLDDSNGRDKNDKQRELKTVQETGETDATFRSNDVVPKKTNADKRANEKSPLTGNGERSTNENNASQEVLKSVKTDSVYGDVSGWEIMKLLDFWLLLVTFIIGSSTDKSMVTNLGTYLRSFGQEKHLHIVMTTAPWIAMVVKVTVGIASDLCREKIPRLAFLVTLLLFKVPLLFAFMLWGDNMVLLYILSYFLFISFGIFFVIGPTLVGEYFGVTYYGRNFGSFLLVEGASVLLLLFMIGVFYDGNVTDEESHTCYGLTCFYVSTGIICGLSIVILCTSILLFSRRSVLRY